MKFQRVVLNLTKAATTTPARFPVTLSRQLVGVRSVEVEAVHVTGLAHESNVPTTKLISIDFGDMARGGTYETITNDTSTSSWFVPIIQGPDALVSYDQPETRVLNDDLRATQIKAFTVQVFDETNAATRDAPQFTGLTVILCFRLAEEPVPVRSLMQANVANGEGITQAGSRVFGYNIF